MLDGVRRGVHKIYYEFLDIFFYSSSTSLLPRSPIPSPRSNSNAPVNEEIPTPSTEPKITFQAGVLTYVYFLVSASL